MIQKLILFLILQGRSIAKFLKLEDNRFILSVHKLLLRLGFNRASEPLMAKIYGHDFKLDGDLSMLPGLLNGTYEKYEIDYVLRTLKEGQIFIDVGANFGLYSVLASRVVGTKGQVIAFEPIPRTFDYLKVNLMPFSQAMPFNLAVGNQYDEINLFYDSERPGCTTSLVAKGQSQKMKMVPLDDFLRTHNISQVDFIKIDVEGYEMEVLQGIKSCLHEKSIVIAEFNPSFLTSVGRDPQEFLDYLKTRFNQIKYVVEKDGSIKSLNSITELKGQIIANLVLSHPRL